MLEMNLYFYLLFLLLPLLFLLINYFKSQTNLPPGPFPWPVIGNLLNMGNKPHISLTHLAKTHGPLMSLRLGTQLLIVGSSPEAATEILKTNDRIISARCVPHAVPASPDRLHFSISWADCTDQWKFLRTLCRTELFSSKAIQSQAKVRDDKVNELMAFLAAKEGESVKIGEVVFDTIFNMLSNLLVSKDLMSWKEGDDHQLRCFVREFVELFFAPNLADYYGILSGFDLQGLNKKSRGIMEKMSRLWVDIIQERREEDKDGGGLGRERDFLDALIHGGLTDDQINYLFGELLIAGGDTSTSTVEWAMAELIKNPNTMKKALDELSQEMKPTLIHDSDRLHLPYINSIVNETLRLHPPAPFLLPHSTTETCKLMDYTIPKDTQVVVNVWAIGRDPTAWEDPLSFRPERFLGSEINSGSLKFIPFGAGRRICPGIPMAAKQVPLIIANLINCFDWSLPDEMQATDLCMDEKFGITLQMEKPLVLIPKVKKT